MPTNENIERVERASNSLSVDDLERARRVMGSNASFERYVWGGNFNDEYPIHSTDNIISTGEFTSNTTVNKKTKPLRQQKKEYLENMTYEDFVKNHGFIDKDYDLHKVTPGNIFTNKAYDNGTVILSKYMKRGDVYVDTNYDDCSLEEYKDSLKLCYIKFNMFSNREKVQIGENRSAVILSYSSNNRLTPTIDMLIGNVKDMLFLNHVNNGTIHSYYYNESDVNFDTIEIRYQADFISNENIIVDIEIEKNEEFSIFDNISNAYVEGCMQTRRLLNQYAEENTISTRRPKVNSTAHRSSRKGTYVSHTVPFSCEIECYGEKKKVAKVSKAMHKDLGMSQDGSLTSSIGYPIEIQTPILQGKRGEICVAELCTMLVDNEFKIDKTCGLHIHLDGTKLGLRNKDILTCVKRPTELINLYLAYRLFEPVILSMLPSTRRNNHYCADFTQVSEHRDQRVSFNPVEQSFEIMEGINNVRDFEMYWYKHNDYDTVCAIKEQRYTPTRYYGVNFHSLLKDNHLEIRYHSGTLNYEKILFWTDLHGKIVDKCADGSITTEMLKEILSSKMDLETLTKTLFSLLDLNKDTIEYLYERQKMFKDAKGSQEILINKTKKLEVE